jgi:integrase
MEHPQRHNRASNLSNVLVERSYLSEEEVDRLMEAARRHRLGHRDATAILVAYQHGLRASELVALRWTDINLTAGRLRIRRSKGSAASVRPISAQESRALRRLRDEAASGRHVFVSEFGDPFRAMGYERMIARAGAEAGFGFVVRSRMLRRELAAERPVAPTMPQ